MGWRDRITRRRAAKKFDAQGLMGALLPGHARTPPERGVQGILEAYSQSPWVRSVSSKVAGAFGAVQWRLYAARETGTQRQWVKLPALQRKGVTATDVRRKMVELPEGVELVEIYEHPALEVLDGSLAFPGNVGRRLTQLYIELTGEAFWLLDSTAMMTGGTVPTGYWLVPPTWIRGVPTEKEPMFVIEPVGARGQSFKVPQEMMIWFVDPNPANPYKRGTGHLRALGDEIDTDEYAARHVRAWFYNSARPDFLVYGKELGRLETQELEQKWMMKLRGYLRSHLPFFLAADVSVKELSHKFVEMQFTELRKFERDMIIHGIGVPPEIFGIIESSNRATIDAADYLFGKHITVPRLEFFRATLQRRLLPFYDERLILGYESPVGQDQEHQLNVAKSRPEAYDLNEWRAMGGHDPDPQLEGLRVVRLTDQVITSEQLVAASAPVVVPPPTGEELGAMGAGRWEISVSPRVAATPDQAPALPRQAQAATQGDTAPSAGENRPQATCAVCGRETTSAHASCGLVQAEGRARVIFDEVNGVVRKQVGGLDTANQATRLAQQMAAEIVEAFGELQGGFDMDGLIAALGRGDVEAAAAIVEAADVPAALEPARQTLRQALLTVVGISAEELAEALGLETAFELTSQAAIQELEAWGAGMVTNVSDESIQAMRTLLSEGYAAGSTPTEIATQLRHSLGLTEPQVKQMLKLWDEWVVALGDDAATEKLARWAEHKIRQRAKTIALNELVKAGTRAQELVWEEAAKLGLIDPKTTRREWIANAGACQICAPMAGARAKLGQPYNNGVYTPNDSHVRCRCSERLVFGVTE